MARYRRPARTLTTRPKPAAPFRRRLVIMAKAPVAGHAKTRLARDIGVAAATGFARHAIATTLARLGHRAPWQTVLAVAPGPAPACQAWSSEVIMTRQGPGDLGRRMQRIMDRMPPGPVVIVGTDIPELRASHIREAFRLLGRHDAVFGPAADGGYWLVGLRRRPRIPAAFAHVRWSSPHALGDTLANLQGYSTAFLDTLTDVDDGEAWAWASAFRLHRFVLSTVRSSANA